MSDTIIQTVLDEHVIQTGIAETLIETTMEETVINSEVSNVIGIAGKHILNDGTEIIISDAFPAIEKDNQLLIKVSG